MDRARVERAKKLANLAGYPEWEDFIRLVSDKRFMASVNSYNAPKEERDLWLGEMRALDKVVNFVHDELRLVKNAIDAGRIKE